MRRLRNSSEELEKRREIYQRDRLIILAKHAANHKANPIKYMLKDAKKRAKAKGLEFNIEASDMVIPEYCPITLLKLVVNSGTMKPNSPTLDRINNDKGYIKGNVAVISNRANAMKRDAYYDEIYRLLIYMENEDGFDGRQTEA